MAIFTVSCFASSFHLSQLVTTRHLHQTNFTVKLTTTSLDDANACPVSGFDRLYKGKFIFKLWKLNVFMLPQYPLNN